MAAWYASGGVMPAILALMAAEAAALTALWWRTGRGVPPQSLLPGIGAGACLIAAAWVALRGGWWGWTGSLLLTGGVLHGIDLRGRWRGRP